MGRLPGLEPQQGRQHPHFARGLNGLGKLYMTMRDLPRAEPLLQQALELRQVTLGEQHPECATSMNNLAALYQLKGNFTEAARYFRQGLTITRENLGLVIEADWASREAVCRNVRAADAPDACR